MIKKTILYFSLIAAMFSCAKKSSKETILTLSSPGGNNVVTFDLSNNSPMYAVKHGAKQIVSPSQMGFVFKDQDSLKNNFEIVGTKESTYDNTWTQVWGEKSEIRNHYNQLTVNLQEKENQKRKLNIEFRAFDDGVAFRYVFPEQGMKDSIFIMDELTEYNLTDDGDAWWIPAYRENRYEYLFTKSPVSTLDTVHTPLTIENKDYSISIHEANLIDFASTTLVNTKGSVLKTDLVPWSDGVKVKTKDSFTTPWKTIQIGEKPTDLITSYLILNLNEPNKIEDTSWIKPFTYMGIWWGMHIGKYSFWEGPIQGATTKHAKEYIDATSDLGIDHLLIEGWNKGWTPAWYENHMHMFSFTKEADNFNLVEVTDYAKEHNVRIIGYHETGSNLINYKKQIDDAFALYNKVGIHDVKIGHVGSKLNMKEWHHGQFGVNYFRYVLKKAADYHLTVLYHEPIKDTGERRTYPNMMSREAARGQEYNAWSDGNPPNYTATLPFTRLLSGPMDFTAGVLDVEVKQGYPGRRIHSTAAKQLALTVVVFSPIQMFADLPENYKGQPAFQFLKEVPTNWEDTKVLNGEIGEYITTARKDLKSGDWFLGSLTNEKARDFNVSLDFLEEGAIYEAQIYADAKGTDVDHNPTAITISKQKVTAKDHLNLHLGASGGAAIRFKKL